MAEELTNQNANAEGTGTQAGVEQKPQTFDDILSNKEYQSEFDKRVAKAIETAKSKWNDGFEKTLEEKLSEAQKLAKMNADQKAQYEREQAEAKLAQREAEITKRELKATAKDTLLSKGLPIELADALVYTDADACSTSMEAVTKAFEQAVTRAVNDRLRQDPPKAGNPNQDDFVAALRNAAGLTNKT